MDFGGADDIRFERRGRAGVVTLTRPKALNALNLGMVRALSAALSAWERDDGVDVVVVTGEGRAFCAGGDIVGVYRARGTGAPVIDFFAEEYRLNAAIARFPKPYVSLIDGIVMGGGVGISAHGSHRVMTEKALFAMPEVGIGFFPDVGGSFVLSRLKRSFGMFLALTGRRIRAGDALRAGLATHVVGSERLAEVISALCETGSPDQALKGRGLVVDFDFDEAELLTISRHFSAGRLADLLRALRQAAGDGDETCTEALKAIEAASPTSVAVAFRQISTGAMLDMDECMRMEFRIVSRMMTGHEFYEGIRAAVVDKDNAPRWSPGRIEEVDDAAVDAYFAPLPGGDLRL
jgi:enoyl-CoA hydratase